MGRRPAGERPRIGAVGQEEIARRHTGEMRRRIFLTSTNRSPATLLALLSATIFALAGCFQYLPTLIERGAPIDEKLVAKIERGKSTRADVLKLFGSPTRVLQYDPKVAGMGAVKQTEQGSMAKGEIVLTANQGIYMWEYEVEKREETMLALRAYVAERRQQAKDSLIVFINRETGIVEDFGFRKETHRLLTK
jgi:hypothetical protein